MLCETICRQWILAVKGYRYIGFVVTASTNNKCVHGEQQPAINLHTAREGNYVWGRNFRPHQIDLPRNLQTLYAQHWEIVWRTFFQLKVGKEDGIGHFIWGTGVAPGKERKKKIKHAGSWGSQQTERGDGTKGCACMEWCDQTEIVRDQEEAGANKCWWQWWAC